MKRIIGIAAVLFLSFTLGSVDAWATLTQTEVSQLYVGVFGRASEGDGNRYWQSAPSSTSIGAVANVMLGTDPAKTYFGATLNDNQAFIEHIYLNTLGKSYAEDSQGIDYWVGELSSGKSKGDVIAALIAAAQHPDNAGDAQDRFNNKVQVSNYCADTIAVYTDLVTFTNFISSVTHDSATVTDAKNAINAYLGTNQKPIASPLSLNVNSAVPYFQQQLIGSDPDGDTINYELISPSKGSGYTQAYVNPTSGMLYIINDPDSIAAYSLSYRVTDGKHYSDPAAINVTVNYLSDDGKNTGKEDVDPKDYSGFNLSTYSSDLLGKGDTLTQPSSIDLSANFPIPGDQGQQNSCVGWATAYALKSYQEKVEIGWSLNTSSHLFSPAFIYNQINIGQDQGSYIYKALDLAVNKGISTLSTMPYNQTDYTTQPSSTALSQALQYKAVSWSKVNDTSQIKAALANRKPVVCGIMLYESIMWLSGSNSVYNTTSGKELGGHAVTIVGYDDNKYNGAFKIINSWSTNWGDNGYFWLPYSFAQSIMSEAYVLEDAENNSQPDAEDPTEPEPDKTTLPNLTVSNWDVNYDPRPNGAGTLTYSVVNTGTGNAAAGVSINLLLSKNTEITSNDYYVVYEEVPFEIKAGASAYRDNANSMPFNFPDQIVPGVYYMALWVDDLDMVSESNERDNISRGSSTLTITNSLPDLSVNTWYADWNGNGQGSLTYEISNSGGSATATDNWGIYLILDPDQFQGNGNEYLLFYEAATHVLNPGFVVFRNDANVASFNLYQDYYGNTIPLGTYFMALWVDSSNLESESNEYNNGSYSFGTVSISTGLSQSKTPFSQEITTKEYSEEYEIDSTALQHGKAYNGRKLPSENVVLHKVEINRNPQNQIIMKSLGIQVKSESISRAKKNASRANLIFPLTEKTPMPNGD
jgi:Papain family cysteine protease/Bacterial Ig domain/Domain of unknown function (DUF4214)/CARDB